MGPGRGMLIHRREHGQVLVVFLLLMLPFFLLIGGIAIGFGSIYAQRSEYYHAANLAATSGVLSLGGLSQANSHEPFGAQQYASGSLEHKGASPSPTAISTALSTASQTLFQQIQDAHLKDPSNLSINYLPPGSINPCSNTPVATPAVSVQFLARHISGPFLSGTLLGVGSVHFAVCVTQELTRAAQAP